MTVDHARSGVTASGEADADVVVIGAGPAGAAAAVDLAMAGLQVVILERRPFPRDKPCAGALTAKAVNRLRFPIDAVARRTAADVEIRVRGRSRHIRAPAPVATMTVRRELDAFCLGQAQAAGAELITEGAAELAELPDRVQVTTAHGRRLSARYVIGADGAASRTRRLIGKPASHGALAIEGTICVPSLTGMMFDIAAVQGGYGWAFAKDDHVNVGLYTATGARLGKSDLTAYVRDAFGAATVDGVVGQALGTGAGASTLGSGRILLVGDAAGMAETLLGEGIHNAIASGQAAAAAIVEAISRGSPALEGYRRQLAPVLADVRLSAWITPGFYAFPRLACAVMTFTPVQRRLADGFARGTPLYDIVTGGRAAGRVRQPGEPPSPAQPDVPPNPHPSAVSGVHSDR